MPKAGGSHWTCQPMSVTTCARPTSTRAGAPLGTRSFAWWGIGCGASRTDGSGARKIDVDESKTLTSWIQPPDDQVLRAPADGSLALLLRDTTSQALEMVSIDGTDGSSKPRTVLHKRYVARGENAWPGGRLAQPDGVFAVWRRPNIRRRFGGLT